MTARAIYKPVEQKAFDSSSDSNTFSQPVNPIMRMIFLEQTHPFPWISFRSRIPRLASEAFKALNREEQKGMH